MDKKNSSDEDINDNNDRSNRIVGHKKYPKSCLICLKVMTNRSLTDTCLHQFCYECLRKWSSDGNCLCPVCRQNYKNIIHNIVSADQYDREPVVQTVEQSMNAIIQLGMLSASRVNSTYSRSYLEKVETLEQFNKNNNEMRNMSKSERTSQRFNQLIRENKALEMVNNRLDIDKNSVTFNANLSQQDMYSALNQLIDGREDRQNLQIMAFVVPINAGDYGEEEEDHESVNDEYEDIDNGLYESDDSDDYSLSGYSDSKRVRKE
ncbi:uncharacterized protein LOC128958221 [Oppia nitens]|uniref:uncharacterized protein LOC128958221 n=1 Tax=Oppia nitens TaxID=1686743 RepID=UPI0023D99FC3|nr:uncharacterized protein LOC128958221 [Oppia nitens]